MSFNYDKERLFKEFADAKNKDIKLSKKKLLEDKENDNYTNRLQFCKDHQELEIKHPEYYEHVRINWDNLVKAYSSDNPRDHFYMTVFGMTYAEKMRKQEIRNFGKG